MYVVYDFCLSDKHFQHEILAKVKIVLVLCSLMFQVDFFVKSCVDDVIVVL